MSVNDIYVPGRLTSAKPDKTIAGANEILDDDLHLKQNAINVLTKKVVTLNSAPTSSTLTYTYNGVTCNFAVGDEVRIEDSSQGDSGTNNYIYYKLFDIDNGVAYWDLIGGREVEIGETSPLTNVKLFVDTDEDPHEALNTYNKAQIDALTRHTRKTDFDLSILQQAVADQNLEKYGLKVGDEKTINGHTYVIAGLNPMKGPSIAVPYIVDVNHVGLIVIPHTKQQWNASGYTNTGANSRGAGYKNSDLHYYLKNTVLPLVETDLGANNLLGHGRLLTMQVNTSGYGRLGSASGCSSDFGWEDNCKICALSEIQVYGSIVYSSSGKDATQASRQLDVFRIYNQTEIFNGEEPWLLDIVTSQHAAICMSHGTAYFLPTDANYDVAALILFH